MHSVFSVAAGLAGIVLFLISSGAGAESSGSVKATPALASQITVVAVGESAVHDSLRVPARVELDQHRLARIGASVTGRITDLKAYLGQEVSKGEVLATLNSTELSAAQSAYLKASTQVNLHRLAVARAQRLLSSDVIASAELQERESQLNEAEVDQRAAADQLRVMGMSESDLARLNRERTIHSFSPVTATLSGSVIERSVNVGQVVQPSDALFTVADLSRVWISAEVPEQQARWARVGDEASADVPALEGEAIAGKLIYVANLVDPETRTVTVRMEVPNPHRQLKPHMLATLHIRKTAVQELVVPEAAVIREGNRDHVFLETGRDLYELRSVLLGARDGDRRRVVSGLRPGDKVVVSGAFHLNNERMRKELE
jgi:cobalt-zinc-cadmium efflux system membrane fusion protein